MNRSATIHSLLAILVSLAVAGAIAWAGSRGGATLRDVPLFAVCGLLAFAINWVAFVPAFAYQTEQFFDLVGSVTYLTVVAFAVVFGSGQDPRALLLAILIAIWALRLGSFLFRRIRKDGSDDRFDALKPDFARFLMTWTLQGLWVFLTLACALAAITSTEKIPLTWVAVVGSAIWLAGFAVEVVADDKWGDESAYHAYKARTSVLIPLPPGSP